jgi:hypothetical protein
MRVSRQTHVQCGNNITYIQFLGIGTQVWCYLEFNMEENFAGVDVKYDRPRLTHRLLEQRKRLLCSMHHSEEKTDKVFSNRVYNRKRVIMATVNRLPLHGVKILDLTRVLAGEKYLFFRFYYDDF